MLFYFLFFGIFFQKKKKKEISSCIFLYILYTCIYSTRIFSSVHTNVSTDIITSINLYIYCIYIPPSYLLKKKTTHKYLVYIYNTV